MCNKFTIGISRFRYGILFLIVVFSFNSFSQNWKWQNPVPQGNKLNCSRFANEHTGFAVGDNGMILKTTDSGQTWSVLESGTFSRLRSLCLLDENTIIVVGGYYPADENAVKSIILRSTDGGSHWTITHPESNEILESVTFTDNQNGYIAGPANTLLKTTNAGVSWAVEQTNLPSLKSLCFADQTKAFATTGGTKIYRSTDKGSSWVETYSFENAELSGVYFVNSLEGFAFGRDWVSLTGLILKTSDGGANWSLKSDLGNVSLSGISSMDFVNDNEGFAVGENGIILRTSDKGNTWVQSQGPVTSWLFSISHSFTSDHHYILFACGRDGEIITSYDSGISWVSLVQGNQLILGGIQLIKLSAGRTIGFAAGGYSFLRKNPDQQKWEVVQDQMPGTISSVFFTDSLTGYACGLGILRTDDAGESWTSVQEGWTSGIYFTDRQNGFALKNSSIISTNDGGQSWTNVYSGEAPLHGICFIETTGNKMTGYAVGGRMNQGVILKTTDGGVNWSSMDSPAPAPLRSVCFPDSMNGFAVGEMCSIIRTRDGGQTWEKQASGLSNPYDWLNSVSFSDANHGLIAGIGGLILKTDDGGANWQRVNSGTENELYSVQMLSKDSAYTCGANGTILSTVNGGGTLGVMPFSSVNCILFAYPNPVTSVVKVLLPSDWTSGNYTLFSATGVNVLYGKICTSEIELEFNNLPPGLYFLTVTSATGRESLILIKE